MGRIKKSYSLKEIFHNEQKTFLKKENVCKLKKQIENSKTLQNLSIRKKPFFMLKKGNIKMNKFKAFLTYNKLPDHPFFENYLKEKQKYILEKKQKLKERKKYIFEKMSKLDDLTKKMIIELYHLEKKINKQTPLFNKNLWASSKKKADTFERMNHYIWSVFFLDFSQLFCEKYNNKLKMNSVYYTNLYIMRLHIRKYSNDFLKKQFRQLSMSAHPDKGGTNEEFELLLRAYNYLTRAY